MRIPGICAVRGWVDRDERRQKERERAENKSIVNGWRGREMKLAWAEVVGFCTVTNPRVGPRGMGMIKVRYSLQQFSDSSPGSLRSCTECPDPPPLGRRVYVTVISAEWRRISYAHDHQLT